MRSSKGLILMLAGLLFIIGTLPGYASRKEAGTSAAVFLNQASSSRLLARGGSGVASCQGQEGLWWNPAGLVLLPAFNAEFSMRRQWSDTESGYMGLAVPTNFGVTGVGLIFSRNQDIAGYDSFGNPTHVFNTQEMATKVGYAWQQSGLAMGLMAEYLQQEFTTEKINGWGGSAGVIWEFHPNLKIGAALLHAGRTNQGSPLELEVRYGMNARVLDTLELGYDLVLPRDAEIYMAGGAEWKPWPFLAVRAGWKNGPATLGELGPGAGLTLGAGLEAGDWFLDYVLEPAGFLGESQHMSLGYRMHLAAPAPAANTTPVLTPLPNPDPELDRPRLSIEDRLYDGKMVFIPKARPVAEFGVKEFHFQVKDPQGKIIRSFSYAGNAIPKELVWDGTDTQGRKVKKDNFSFAFEYISNKATKTEEHSWPIAMPVRKLFFEQNGAGIASEVVFRFKGDRQIIQSWQLRIFERKSRKMIMTMGGLSPLPEQWIWNGRTQKNAWARVDVLYGYELQLESGDGGKTILTDFIIPIQAKIFQSGMPGVQFRILEILFDFNQTKLSPDMADKIEKAAEVYTCYPRAQVLIRGHADDVGSDWMNLNISRSRAEEVKALLRVLGVPRDWPLLIVGLGKQEPLLKTSNEKLKSKNRRVEIQFQLPKSH